MSDGDKNKKETENENENLTTMLNEGTSKKMEQSTSEKSNEMSTKEAYFASLNEWVRQANISQNAMAMFPWYLFNNYPQLFQSQAASAATTPYILGSTPAASQASQQIPLLGANANANVNAANDVNSVIGFRILSEQAQTDLIHSIGGYEYVIAPFWKRGIAELIDVVILLLIKIMITFTIVNVFDFDIGFDLDKEVLRKAIDDDDLTGFLSASMDFFAFSSDLLMLEVVTKIIVCFYEATWATIFYGATPGKVVMNLRILYVEAVLPLQPPVPPQLIFQGQRMPMRALLSPGSTPTFGRAFLRAIAKNTIMTLLFPMCFIMFFFKNNRTAYDVITKTIVVENTAEPEFRYR